MTTIKSKSKSHNLRSVKELCIRSNPFELKETNQGKWFENTVDSTVLISRFIIFWVENTNALVGLLLPIFFLNIFFLLAIFSSFRIVV